MAGPEGGIRCVVRGDAVLIPVRAQPGASQAGVVGARAGRLKIAVTQPAESGRANQALVSLLASALGVRPSAVTLTQGATSRDKVFRVVGVDGEAVDRLLDRRDRDPQKR